MRTRVILALAILVLVLIVVWQVPIWPRHLVADGAGLGALLQGIGTLLTGLSVLGAVYLFHSRKQRGYEVPNLSIAVSCDRRESDDPAKHWLSIQALLKKGDRGLVTVQLASCRLFRLDRSDLPPMEPLDFWGTRIHRVSPNAYREPIGWDPSPGDALNLPPGEETQFATALRIPADGTYRIDVAVRAVQAGENKCGQWNASTVSVPQAFKPLVSGGSGRSAVEIAAGRPS